MRFCGIVLGFPRRNFSDSTFMLEEEASMHGKTLFDGSSGDLRARAISRVEAGQSVRMVADALGAARRTPEGESAVYPCKPCVIGRFREQVMSPGVFRGRGRSEPGLIPDRADPNPCHART